MFKQKHSGVPENVDTVVGASSVFEGNIESQGSIKVDGKLKGDVKTSGDVYVGTNAVITGNITAGNVSISGTVEGNVASTGLLRLLTTAKLFGDIQVHSFVADEGGIFHGKCSMVETPQLEKSVEKPISKKSHASKDYKKSSVLDQIYDEKEKNDELK